MKDYHPISLIHLLDNLFSKVFTNMLAPRLQELVHCSQRTFKKGSCIHDSFKFVQTSTKLHHARRQPTFLLKIDIVRTFNSVAWQFLLEILQHMGFPNGWLNWISIILSSTSTQVLLNGSSGERICHAHGLRQDCSCW
jgi:hypothetical protein